VKKSSVSNIIRVQFLRLAHGEGLPLPAYKSEQAAGMDLLAAVEDSRPVLLVPGGRALIPTGLILELPTGTEAQVRPRSGLALRHGITVLNSPGTIDSDYRGELKVLLINFGHQPWEIQRGERIAQLVVQRVAKAELVEVGALSRTARADGGFGSTDEVDSEGGDEATPVPRARR
jgi:dUTP pyrophosphatase